MSPADGPDREEDGVEEMAAQFAVAADRFGAVLDGATISGWHGRSLSGRVTLDGQRRWLRVVTEQDGFREPTAWTGNHAANVVDLVPKPSLLRIHDWTNGHQLYRAELMTIVEEPTVAPHAELRREVPPGPEWFSMLSQHLDRLATVSTHRVRLGQVGLSRALRERFGSDIDPRVEHWTTAHGDLTWNNITAPTGYLLDWEGWGRAPAGFDAATLYCTALLSPTGAARAREAFAEHLASPAGVRAQLYVISRFLRRIEVGDHPDLGPPLLELAAELLPSVRADRDRHGPGAGAPR